MNKTYLLILGLLFISSKATAQFRVLPISQAKRQHIRSEKKLFRIQQDTIRLDLPFFEDFSTTPVGELDSTKWFPSNVFVNNGIPIHPPTKNAVTFDGTKADGTPYSKNTPTRQGVGDSLTSQRIDLSEANEELFFSFMWQSRGNAESPDPIDYLRLEFLDLAGKWNKVWQQNGGYAFSKKRFQHEILPVLDEKYFHPNFQFRFTSHNRLSGTFDVWNVDYIYLNQNRTAEDTVFLDLALSQTPTYFTKPYSAIPYTHFWSDTSSFLVDSVRTTVNNLDKIFNILSYQCLVRNAATNEVLGYWRGLKEDENTSSVLVDGFEQSIILKAAPYASMLPQKVDSMKIRYEFQANTKEPDSNFGGVYTRSNDTISQTTVFKDYYAYDDGTAEFAAGINQRQGQLAYRYYINTPDVLTDIDIYFPQIGKSAQNQTFNLKVWKNLDFSTSDIKDDVLLTQNVVMRYTDSLNKFIRFKLNRPIEISDTLFIGIQQLSGQMLPIGLDVQTSSSENIYFNVRNYWEKNQTLEGSLMIRPVFSKEVVTGTEQNDFLTNLVIYPNPVRNRIIHIKGLVEEVSLHSLTGTKIKHWNLMQHTVSPENEKVIRLPRFLPTGLYLLRCKYKDAYVTKKLVVE